MTCVNKEILVENENYELAFIEKKGNFVTRVMLKDYNIICHQNGEISIRFKFPDEINKNEET